MQAPTPAQAPMSPSAQNLTPVCDQTPYIDTRHRLFDDQESQDEPKLARLSEVSTTSQEFTMNKDQVKGAAKDLGGKIQQEVGKLVGSTEQQAKGLKNQAEGELQEHLGDLKENLKDARDAVKDALKP
ncbi:CsbD family protein [Candidatus Accumulibacter phosphatis]